MRAWRETATGAGGVALIGLDGPGAARWLEERFRPARARGLPAPGRVALGALAGSEGPLDEVLLAREAGERFVLSCHAGEGVVGAILAELQRAGAELAAPAALEHPEGRVVGEALELLPRATSELACQVLLRAGDALGREVEASLAAPDPARLARLLGTARLGRWLGERPQVALIGAPNAGKSSLLNALVGRSRALVHGAAGTTRDAVSAEAELAGLGVRLIDTAGQRETAAPLEAAGIERARARAATADLRLVVIDGSAPDPAALALAAETPAPRLVVWNKADLDPDPPPSELAALAVSARERAGLSALAERARQALVGDVDPAGPVVFTTRQAGLVAAALRASEGGDPARARRCLRALVG